MKFEEMKKQLEASGLFNEALKKTAETKVEIDTIIDELADEILSLISKSVGKGKNKHLAFSISAILARRLFLTLFKTAHDLNEMEQIDMIKNTGRGILKGEFEEIKKEVESFLK